MSNQWTRSENGLLHIPALISGLLLVLVGESASKSFPEKLFVLFRIIIYAAAIYDVFDARSPPQNDRLVAAII